MVDTSKIPTAPGGSKVAFTDLEGLYKINDAQSNWYTTLPYGFKITLKNKSAKIIYLPINPSNINITTHMATNVITTLYGVVEEHSEIRYYDITIQGTTGYMPQHVEPIDAPDAVEAGPKKESFGEKLWKQVKAVGQSMADAASEAAGNAAGKKADLPVNGRQAAQGNESPMGRIGAEVSAVFPRTAGILKQSVNMLMPSDDMRNGTDKRASGYVAFHNLQRMFMAYKQDVSSADKAMHNDHPIKFLNAKDKIQYDCAPIQFSVTRSAESPMLYNYSLSFRAYNLTPIDAVSMPKAGKDQLEMLGLSGYGNSLVKGAKKLAGKATSIVGAAKSIGGGKK